MASNGGEIMGFEGLLGKEGCIAHEKGMLGNNLCMSEGVWRLLCLFSRKIMKQTMVKDSRHFRTPCMYVYMIVHYMYILCKETYLYI